MNPQLAGAENVGDLGGRETFAFLSRSKESSNPPATSAVDIAVHLKVVVEGVIENLWFLLLAGSLSGLLPQSLSSVLICILSDRSS